MSFELEKGCEALELGSRYPDENRTFRKRMWLGNLQKENLKR